MRYRALPSPRFHVPRDFSFSEIPEEVIKEVDEVKWWELGRAFFISIPELSEYEERWFDSWERQTLEIIYSWQEARENGHLYMFAGSLYDKVKVSEDVNRQVYKKCSLVLF